MFKFLFSEKLINQLYFNITMKVDKDLIDHVANVARINLTDKERDKFTSQVKEILDFFSELDKFDVKNVKPSFHPVELNDKLREDLVEPNLSQEQALSNSEHKKDGYFKGPRVV